MKEQFNHSATKVTIKSLFTAGRSEKLGVAESLDGPTLNQRGSQQDPDTDAAQRDPLKKKSSPISQSITSQKKAFKIYNFLHFK